MKSTVADIVIQNIEFFSLASDSEINPDVAVKQLESIASLLKELPNQDLEDFLARVTKRLEKLQREGASTEQLNLLRNIREHLGI
jgi:hypothetical protein